MKYSLSLFILFFTHIVHSQSIGGVEEIDDAQVSPWNVSQVSAYEGVYSLGFSEGEYSLVIVIAGDFVEAQIKAGEFAEDEAGMKWVTRYETLHHVWISGNRFYSDEFNGQFAVYNDNGKKVNGFKRLESDDLHKNYEFGSWSPMLIHYFNGKYPESSYILLTEETLASMSKEELQIMRNEIFARYGYQFNPGGKMYNYFIKKDWYQGEFTNVDNMLTELERANITLIQLMEKQ